jgi:hypothetical protein
MNEHPEYLYLVPVFVNSRANALLAGFTILGV